MRSLTLAALALLMGTAAHAADLRIGLQDDADTLDPDQSRTFVGRIVYAGLCDKLVDTNPSLEIVPMLATEWSWSDDGTVLTMQLREGVTFHDGAAFDAAAAVANLERSLNLPESRRKSELASIASVRAAGPMALEITLKAPDATFLSQLTDRAGMMVSPAAAEAAGADFGLAPVCSGPFKFRERVQQDRIVLERFADYWNADAIHFDTVTYLPIPDTTVRLANLRAGDLDLIERLAATDLAAAEGDANLTVEKITSLGYQGMTINIANGDAGNPAFEDARVRQALSLAIDREALNQVVFEGAYSAGNQFVAPTSGWYDARFPVQGRDVEAAKALLAEAGLSRVRVKIATANNPVQMQSAQVVQAMVGEAGFDVEIVAKEFATLLSDQSAGAYEVTLVGWSGRTDPDGNIHTFVTTGGGLNETKFTDPEVDRQLNAARTAPDTAARKVAYDAASEILMRELPIIYLYHPAWLWAFKSGIEGFTAHPDGMIRLQGLASN